MNSMTYPTRTTNETRLTLTPLRIPTLHATRSTRTLLADFMLTNSKTIPKSEKTRISLPTIRLDRLVMVVQRNIPQASFNILSSRVPKEKPKTNPVRRETIIQSQKAGLLHTQISSISTTSSSVAGRVGSPSWSTRSAFFFVSLVSSFFRFPSFEQFPSGRCVRRERL